MFAPEPHEALVDQFSSRNVEINHEQLPAIADDGFVLVQQDGVALGSISIDALRAADRTTVAPTESVRLHEVADDADIGQIWFVAFRATGPERVDDGQPAGGSGAATGSGSNSCALLAQEREPDRDFGFWTYDDELVAEIDDHLAATYG